MGKRFFLEEVVDYTFKKYKDFRKGDIRHSLASINLLYFQIGELGYIFKRLCQNITIIFYGLPKFRQ